MTRPVMTALSHEKSARESAGGAGSPSSAPASFCFLEEASRDALEMLWSARIY